MELGEGFVGTGSEAAHVNTVLGPRDGPVGTAWATALATPRAGHAAFVAVLQPGLPVQPLTLFVNKATLEGEVHARMTWGPAQAGVAAGVADAVAAGTIAADDASGLVLIVAVWVDPAATDADLVFANNREATATALRLGRAGLPSPAEVVAQRDAAWNPFFPRHRDHLADPPRSGRGAEARVPHSSGWTDDAGP
jgi:5,6,7,8-tetrahydromethanopterin hydro-lyase